MRRNLALNHLKMWTIYDHPVDYPNHFVARLFVIKAGDVRPTQVVITHEYLEHLRALLPKGLTCLPSVIGDEPNIIESWF